MKRARTLTVVVNEANGVVRHAVKDFVLYYYYYYFDFTLISRLMLSRAVRNAAVKKNCSHSKIYDWLQNIV